MANNTFNPISDAMNIKQRPEQHAPFTTFNRSKEFIGTGSMGQIIPFFFDETMPGDYWKISGEYLFRFAPLYLPIFTQVKVYVDYYYVPLRILYGIPKQYKTDTTTDLQGWENFISSFDDSLSLPTVDLLITAYNDPYQDEIISYFGIPTDENGIGAQPLRIIPFPFLAYLAIYDQYYRNDQVQDTRSFLWLDSEAYDMSDLLIAFNQFGQMSYDATPGDPATYLSKLRRNWDNDYFTVMTPTPQLGANVLVPMINDLTDYWQTELSTTSDTTSYPSRWKVLIGGGEGPFQQNLVTGLTPDSLTTAGGVYVGLNIQETAASIAQLRKQLMLQEIMERAMRTGDKYPDFIFKFHGEDIDPLNLSIPQWFGGHVGRVVVSDVFATASTGTGTADSVGSFAGNAVAIDKVKMNQVKCREHGYILGLLSVVPESSYQNGLHPLWTREKWYDFPFEQFALLGDRPVKGMEMQLILRSASQPAEDLNDIDNNTRIIGYLPQYHEMRYTTSTVAGQMRKLWESYHLGRIFGQNEGDELELNDELLLCIPRILDVFQITPYEGGQEDEIHILVHNVAFVDRRLPKYAVPKVGL